MKNRKQFFIMKGIAIIGVSTIFILRFVAHLFIPDERHIDLNPVYERQKEYKRLKALKILEKDNYTK